MLYRIVLAVLFISITFVVKQRSGIARYESDLTDLGNEENNRRL